MNRIEKIENIKEINGSLERLIMYGNQVRVIEGLEGMQSLKEVNLKKNKIGGSSMSNLGTYPVLLKTIEVLNLSYNEIEESDLDNVATVILQMK